MYVSPQHHLIVTGKLNGGGFAQVKWEARTMAAKLDSAAPQSYTDLRLELFQTRPRQDSWAFGAAPMSGRAS
jgi:hypothetical protein